MDDKDDYITITGGGYDTLTLNNSVTTSVDPWMYSGAGASSTITMPTTYTIANGAVGSSTSYNWGAGIGSISSNSSSSITVKGDAEFEGDIKVDGKSLCKWMETMEKRLAILVPDPKKLAKYEALQKAYNNYKMLEALCDAPEDDDTQ
jgi:hypothetical protein